LRGHNNYVTSVAFSPDGEYLATGSYDKTIKLWNVKSQSETATLHGHSQEVNSVAFSPDGKYLASGGNDKIIKLWSFEFHKEEGAL
jgi:WD40 repeat protein